MKKILIILTCACFLLSGCSTPGIEYPFAGVASENPDIPTIAISKLFEDNRASVAMSIGVFGVNEEDLQIAGLEVYINDNLGLVVDNPEDYYKPETQLVVFILEPLSDGDKIDFLIFKYDEPASKYGGVISDTENTFAEIQILSDEESIDVTDIQ